MYSTEIEEKSSVCERWNRTIKIKMWNQLAVRGNTIWYNILDDLVEKYIHTKHSSMKMTPTEGTKKKSFISIYTVIPNNHH